MRIASYPYGPLGSNLFVLSGFPDSDKLIVVDPSCHPKTVEKESFDVDFDISKVEAIFITHGHYDHLTYVDAWRSYLDENGRKNVKIYLHPNDHKLLIDPMLNCSSDFGSPQVFDLEPSDIRETDGKLFFDGNARCRIIETPGHSDGEVCIIFEHTGNGPSSENEDISEERYMFTGDMLFAGSIGRTDLPSGNAVLMFSSIDLLKNLKDDYVVLPGHGPATSLSKEIRINPYFNL